MFNTAVMAGTSYEPVSQEDIEDDYPDAPRKARATVTHDIRAVRPIVYYNDGPFSAPSSVDESQENLLGNVHDHFSLAETGYLGPSDDKELHTRLERASGLKVVDVYLSKRTFPVRLVALCLVSLLGLFVVIGVVTAFTSGNNYRTRGSKQITMDHVFNGTFGVERKFLNWVPEGAPDRIDRTYSHMTL